MSSGDNRRRIPSTALYRRCVAAILLYLIAAVGKNAELTQEVRSNGRAAMQVTCFGNILLWLCCSGALLPAKPSMMFPRRGTIIDAIGLLSSAPVLRESFLPPFVLSPSLFGTESLNPKCEQFHRENPRTLRGAFGTVIAFAAGMDSWLIDVNYAIRSLRRRPTLVLIVVLTLALGIGSNTAIFSVVNGFLFRPLPFPNSKRLMALYETTQTPLDRGRLVGSTGNLETSYADFLEWQRQNRVFESMSVFVAQSVNLTGTARPDRVRGGFVSADFFSVLGTGAFLGRTFLPKEDDPGSHVVVLQYDLWKNRFSSDPNILGKKLILNSEPFTIIGVMPPQFQFPLDECELWMPATSYPGFTLERTERNFFVIALLKQGISHNQAKTEMDAIARNLAEQFPDKNSGIGARIEPFRSMLVQDIKAAMLILLGAVAFILLIGCANIANLLLSLGVARKKEFGIKAAIGATRSRLVRQMLIETVLLGILGGVAGILFGMWGVELLLKMSPQQLPGGIKVGLDLNVLAFSFVLSILAAIIFGLGPAIQLSGAKIFHFLREGGDSVSRHQGHVNRLLVISQISLSLMLLIGSGLLMKSFWQLLLVKPGIRPDHLLSLEYRLPRNQYTSEDHQWRFHAQVIHEVRQVSGVESAAIVRGLPFSGNGGTIQYTVPGRPLPSKGSEPVAEFNTASAEYFQTIGIPLLKGRNFQTQDRLEAPLVILVNQKLADRVWPGEEPIGKQLHFPNEGMTGTVIGIVGNAKHSTLNEDFQPQVYVTLSQNPGFFATLVARTSVDPMSLADEVKNAVWKVDANQPVWKVRTMESLLKRDVSARRFVLILLIGFAVLAIVLTLVGLYGVVSHFVRRRVRDIGIRMALGAQRHDILRMVFQQGFTLAIAGALIGLAGTLAIARVLTSFLFQVKPSDPWIILSGVLLLILASILTTLIPAYRATRINPIIALHYE